MRWGSAGATECDKVLWWFVEPGVGRYGVEPDEEFDEEVS